MNYEFLVTQLAQHAHAIKALARNISPEDARWKPDADSWSILKVINHLCDKERRDFRVRLAGILHLRQLVELHYALVKQHATPYILEYTGEW